MIVLSSPLLKVSAATLLLLSLPGGELTLRSEAGSQTSRTLSIEATKTTNESMLSIMDQEQDAGSGMEVSTVLSAKFADEVVEAEDGRATLLRRLYEEIGLTREAGEVADGIELAGTDDKESLLAGHTVDFRLKDDEYEASFAEDDEGGATKDGWLEDLVADQDMSFLLPEGEVSEGDTWEIDLDLTDRLLNPAGRITFFVVGVVRGDEEGMLRITIPDVDTARAIEDPDGEINVSYAGTREEDGVEVAVLTIELEVSASMDVSDAINADRLLDGEEEYDALEASTEREYEATGELLWNLETGRLHAFHLDLTIESTADASWSIDAGGMDLELSISQDVTEVRVIDLR